MISSYWLKALGRPAPVYGAGKNERFEKLALQEGDFVEIIRLVKTCGKLDRGVETTGDAIGQAAASKQCFQASLAPQASSSSIRNT